MEFKDFLKINAQKIEAEQSKILSNLQSEVTKISPKLVPLVKEFIKSSQGGKRIRGVLCKLGCGLASSKFKVQNSKLNKEIIKAGAVLEILHTAILIHDDIIDQSPKRRGQPTLYQALGGNHYGISQALVLGDIGLYLQNRIIINSAFPQKYKIKALSFLSQTIINTGIGQLLDVELHRSDFSKADQLETQKLYLFKTALYTISGPLILGAILAGAQDKLIKDISHFGQNLGIAYQIQDDILDSEANDWSKKQLAEYTARAEKIIPKLTSSVKIRKLLKSLCQYLLERTN